MIKKKLSLVLNKIIITIMHSLVLNKMIIILHTLLGGIGVFLYCTLGKDSEIGFYGFIVIYVLFKFLWFYYCSIGKKIIEKTANFFVMLFLGFIDFIILFYIILVTGEIVHLGKLISFNILQFLFYILLVIMSTIVMPIIEKKIMNGMKSENILPFITVAILECVISIILIYTDTKESAIISAFVALFILMLTPQNLEALFNIKVSKYREQQISLLKFYVIFLLPFIYILSKILPLPVGDKIKNTDIMAIVVFRFLCLVIIWLIPMIVIYFKKPRRFFQTYFGLTSSQIELNGNWNMVVINKYTGENLLVRNFFLNIDGIRIKHKDTIFYFNEEYEIFNDEEKIGIIKKINSNEIILVFDSCEDKNSKFKNTKFIHLIRIGSDKYNSFNRDYEKEKVRFHNIKIMDPITQEDIEVTIFLSQNDKKHYTEINSRTNDTYILKNGKLNRLGSQEILIDPDIYESDTFN
ncbi:hypothetical protein [Streptococcus parasanguinis]|uniref:hypothetical protein n=1 Tax=Streptococcus parasanguinis TaxID=1318 RepID=UPI00215034AB|nr:hypothetical protein [Streptococcus parasanguinis]MCR4485460.1 hypothetical protein [Streptococcus parasanguinis]